MKGAPGRWPRIKPAGAAARQPFLVLSLDDAFKQVVELWSPIFDEFDRNGVKFAFEVHPAEIAFDLYTARRLLEEFKHRPTLGFNFDPSHLHWQGMKPHLFIRDFSDRILHVHMKDCAVKLDGRAGILGSHLPFGDNRRGWNFRSLGHGDVDFENIIRELNAVNYQGRSRWSGRTLAWSASTALVRRWHSPARQTSSLPGWRSTTPTLLASDHNGAGPLATYRRRVAPDVGPRGGNRESGRTWARGRRTSPSGGVASGCWVLKCGFWETKMRVALGCDDAAFDLKETIKGFQKGEGVEVTDFGTRDASPVTYPEIAFAVADEVASGRFERAILICGTGIGMAICANKVPGVRAALAHDTYSAQRARKSNDAQVLTMGARVIGPELAKTIVKAWLKSEFEPDRSGAKVDLIRAYEKRQSTRANWR